MKSLALAPALALAVAFLAPSGVEAREHSDRGRRDSGYSQRRDSGRGSNRYGYDNRRDAYRGSHGSGYSYSYRPRYRSYRYSPPLAIYGYGGYGYDNYGYNDYGYDGYANDAYRSDYDYGYYAPPPPIRRHCRPRPRISLRFGY